METGAAMVKRRVAAGELSACEVVLACPWMVRSMAVAELLACQPWWGWIRCRTCLESVGLDESKVLGGLTERQRVALAVVISRKGGGRPSSHNRPSQ
jgi:hypothetical protein